MSINLFKPILSLLLVLILASCNNIPASFTETKEQISIYPDYKDVSIPLNIAPLNFHITTDASSYLTKVYSTNGNSVLVKGKDVQIGMNAWKKMLTNNAGNDLYYEIYLKRGGVWIKYPILRNYITKDSIDKFVVYRYVQPLYTTYEDMSINQRCLENFDVEVLMDNRLYSADNDPHCINCHSFQNYNATGNMQIHVRGKTGGTILALNHKLKKINPKAKGLKSGAVYPSWHPTMNYIAYSTNSIGQNFHSKSPDKVEVLDSRSDLILYDIDKNEVTKITDSNDWLETFPYWSPDGSFLYYVAAYFVPKQDSIETEIQTETIFNYKNIKYNIVRRPFDKTTKTFGKADTIFSASKIGKSATLPRVSPDGKYVLFTLANYGNFHIWHKSSDLYLLDLATGKLKDIGIVNSTESESYHSWSSNGRWIIFGSRREDGTFTRLYLSNFDKNGMAHRPFVLPQKDPQFYNRDFKSYNIPEFIVKPVESSGHQLFKTTRMEAKVASMAK